MTEEAERVQITCRGVALREPMPARYVMVALPCDRYAQPALTPERRLDLAPDFSGSQVGVAGGTEPKQRLNNVQACSV